MTATTLDALSRLLGEDFTDLRPLGENGGLSRLFRARKQSLNVDVVIKRMRMDPRGDVKREARILTSLRHQYLPRVYDFKVDDQGYCYTIMELIPGCTLRQYVARHGALDQKQTLRWLEQLGQAVAYMHSQKPPIIHSDIKPDNVMITPQGDVCLIDFNTSLEMKEGGVAALGATMNYAAPEQFNVPLSGFGDPAALTGPHKTAYEMAKAAGGYGKVTEKTDIYALGATAYFMLTGYDPACWNQPLIDLNRYDITLGDPFRQAILRCMEHDPKRRFSSANEMLRALGGLAKLDSRYRAWRRTCRVTALAVGAGLILSAFCVVWGVMLSRSESGEAYNDLIRQAQLASGTEMEETLLLQAIALDRGRPEAYANLGALLYAQGDYQQAVELLEDVETGDTGGLGLSSAKEAYGQVQYVLASSLYQLEDYESALESYRMAAELCSDSAGYWRDLAVCYAKNSYPQQAQEALAKLERLKTQPGDTELVHGEILYASGDYAGALEKLTAALQKAEDAGVISRAGIEAAACCQHLGTDWLAQEIEVLKLACSRLGVPANGIHTRQLADAYLRLAAADRNSREDNYRLALDCLQDLMDRGNPEKSVRLNTALALEYLGEYTEAETILLGLTADYPKDYVPQMRLALLYADREAEKSAAQRNYQQVLDRYELAENLYTDTGVPDSEMLQLRELVYQLKK